MSVLHFGLLLFWILVGACLRGIDLATLPPWTDEAATVVFSLGNSFYNVPLDRFIDLQTLVEPLQINPSAGINDTIDLLLTESTHPPLYFVLTHWWLKLFPAVDGLASIWAARSLSALFGIISIPAIFYFTRLTCNCLAVAQIAAAIMAFSPFGVFLGLQARHYTLIILIIIASLCCFIYAWQAVERNTFVPLWLVLLWIGINSLGVATHYFFVLSLMSMAIAFIPLMYRHYRYHNIFSPAWRRIYLAALGSLIGCLVWVPSLIAVRDSSATDWIYASNATTRWLEPIGRFLLWLMSTVMLLPSSVYDFSLSIIIISGIITLIFWVWHLPPIVYGVKLQRQNTNSKEAITALSNYLLAAIALFFLFTYSGMDLTLAGRFQFVYFPVVVVLVAVGLGHFWQLDSKLKSDSYFWLHLKNYYDKKIAIVFLAISFLGGVVANLNLGYLQNHRPDLAVNKIVEGTKAPPAIVTSYRHHGQTGRMIALAWGLKNLPNIDAPQFFLAQKDPAATLSQKLAQLGRPLDLWLINFHGDVELENQNCLPDSQYRGMVGQYQYELYRCK